MRVFCMCGIWYWPRTTIAAMHLISSHLTLLTWIRKFALFYAHKVIFVCVTIFFWLEWFHFKQKTKNKTKKCSIIDWQVFAQRTALNISMCMQIIFVHCCFLLIHRYEYVLNNPLTQTWGCNSHFAVFLSVYYSVVHFFLLNYIPFVRWIHCLSIIFLIFCPSLNNLENNFVYHFHVPSFSIELKPLFHYLKGMCVFKEGNKYK